MVSHTWNCFDNDSDIGVVLLAFHFCSFIKTISTHSFSWISMDWKSSCSQKCLRHLSSIYECSMKLWKSHAAMETWNAKLHFYSLHRKLVSPIPKILHNGNYKLDWICNKLYSAEVHLFCLFRAKVVPCPKKQFFRI